MLFFKKENQAEKKAEKVVQYSDANNGSKLVKKEVDTCKFCMMLVIHSGICRNCLEPELFSVSSLDL